MKLRIRFPRLRRIVLFALVVALAAGALLFIGVDRSIVARFEARTASFPSRVYSRAWELAPGEHAEPSEVARHLARLGYRAVEDEPDRAGEYRRRGRSWTVWLRGAETAAGPRQAFPARLQFTHGGRLVRVVDERSDEPLDAFALEPEPLLTFYADLHEERRWLSLEEMPGHLVQAVVAVEDRRFRRHHGIDLAGIGRAFAANVRAGEVVQGGSTITQQLAKNLWGTAPRTLRRKLLEALAGVALELHYDKDEILEAYLNEVYLGQTGAVAISGVDDASRFFFGAPATDLDLARAALLAGLIRNPGGYNPRRHPELARERRDLVLGLMVEQRLIAEEQAALARRVPLGVLDEPPLGQRQPWIEDWLAETLEPLVLGDDPTRAGYSIFTTFDARVQRAAEQALARGLERVEKRLGGAAGGTPLEGAVVVLDPRDGSLLALVGGRDWRRSQFNRAARARRPPGSTFKPFVFLAALERTLAEPEFGFTVATRLDDAPLAVPAGGETWRPDNFDRTYRGEISARQALEDSVNVPTVRTALLVGLERVVEMAERSGIESELDSVPALALGSEEVTPLELAAAYATLASGGRRVEPRGIVALVDRAGGRIEPPVAPPEQVIDEALAYVMTDVLAGVMQRGTARSAASLGFRGVAAGKTGSSDGLRDAWFVGYTPEVVALVWVGYDDNRPVGLSGSAAALPIWVDLMRAVDADLSRTFPRPQGVVREWIDPQSGGLATSLCPEIHPELFVAGTEPAEPCELHEERSLGRGLWRWLRGRTH